jgi:hypothetical protein
MATVSGGVPLIDFSAIGNLPKTIREARKGQREEEREITLADIGKRVASGELDFDTAAKHMAAVRPDLVIPLAQMADARALREYNMKKDEREFGLRERQVNATLEGGKVTPGFERDPAGGLRPIKGGPQDPEYIRQTAEVKAKPREFSVGDVTKLSEEGGKFADVARFNEKFEDRFGGYKGMGGAALMAGRHLPESVVGKDVAEAATFWQGYDRYKNVVRNDLFGSALTRPETEAFERADINANMDSAQIRKNLKVQQEIVKNGLKRKANALIQSGYDPKAIGAAYGLDLKDIGVEAAPKRGGAPAGRPAAAPSIAKGRTATNPQTGEKVVFDGAQWVPAR